MGDPSLRLSFTIGEVSQILDIPVDTLRYYDKIGLLAPHVRDTNKYRYYDLEQFDSLITIRMLRAMEVPIERIQELLKERELTGIQGLLREKRTDIDRRLAYLNRLSGKLDSLHAKLRKFEDADTIELVKTEPAWVLLTDSIMESGDRKLGSRVQEQVRRIREPKEWVAFCHIISIVSQENLQAGRYHNYLNNGILSTHPMDGEGETFRKLEPFYCARKYVVIGKDDYAKLDEHYEHMKAFIARRGFRIAGHSLEINLYNQYDRHYIEIHIPIAEK
ncbi:MerR family transcriptional regulator [Cohnella sp. CIP 111063]|jgi:DNA-binding transcriptional MerR regulator|uniref:MerR family transcriptional regulator n=1 Tax=unclassified Cohnella TaxID=2636738 RepID=UPI000B8C1491|nr:MULTISPECIES: MerR family transcriptional regulator [unclassified Cohnella]OXS58875.1 MerR family transcriptional regulator [Cohnella sp. CIP 111063]PRX71967.1 DNA-binding transcriptional MerR regulator [Cohnella sp. SGD-V74]